MKNISIIAAALLLGTSAMAQQSLPHGKHLIGKQQGGKLEKSRQMTRMIMGESANANKSTATYYRMKALSEYGQQQLGGPVVFFDSIALTYSGMRGSEFDYNSMSVGFFDPVSTPMVPENRLRFFPDDFKVYAPNLVNTYTFTYDNNENVTEMYLSDNTGGQDERVLLTYANSKLVLVEDLMENGPNWDTAYKRYFAYDVNGVLMEDSLMENMGGNVWAIEQKCVYAYDMNGNLTSLTINNTYNNGAYEPAEEDHFTYNNNDQMITSMYAYYDGNNMVPTYKDSFEYTTGFDFYTKDNYYSWDDANGVWEDDGHADRILNTDMKPEMVLTYSWDGTNSVQEMEEHYMYDVNGNPIHDSLFLFTNNTIDEDPVYVTHFYYEEYSDLSVGRTAGAQPDILVYPNPVTDVMTINSSSNEAMNLQLVNALGQTVKKARTTGQGKLSIGNLTPGMYWLTVTDVQGNKLHTQAIVKQ